MYQNAVNRLLRHPDDKPTIGLLLYVDANHALCYTPIVSVNCISALT